MFVIVENTPVNIFSENKNKAYISLKCFFIFFSLITQQTRHVETIMFLMLAQRLRRWPNIKTSLFQRVVLAENLCDGSTPLTVTALYTSV